MTQTNSKEYLRESIPTREAMIELQIALSGVSAVGPENGGDGELLKANLLKDRLIQIGI